MMKERLLVIVGPTAVGKTEISIELAKQFTGEIISGDSMQIYRGLDIGTAKVTEEEMEGIPHYMVDIKEPNEPFSVSDFQKEARQIISHIHCKQRLPILVGGTGLYIQAITHDYQFTSFKADPIFRAKMEDYAEQYGNHALHDKLHIIDASSYKNIHPNNRRRVIRALEVHHVTGEPFSKRRTQQHIDPIYDTLLIGLTMDREELYDRINRRVDDMIEEGLIEEAAQLYRQGIKNSQAIQAIGYKELFLFFDGTLSKHEAIELLKRNSRRYAKRQLTWFKNKMDVTWFNMTNHSSEKKQKIIEYVAGKFY